jgi:hypothetical protein
MIGKSGAALLSLALVLGSEAHAQEEALRQAARLDGEQKCEEAERYYLEAFAAVPSSPAVLNNAGNHYWRPIESKALELSNTWPG